MKRIEAALAFIIAAALPVCAQVSVELKLPQDQFLPNETLSVAVRISNRSGQMLRLGAEQDWLTFGLEAQKGSVVPKLGDPDVVGEFEVPSSKVAIKRVDLAPYFNVSEPGRYSVTATVRIKGWDREITSPPKSFNIVNGAPLWEQEFGVPGSTNGVPEVRKYLLEQANYLKGQIRLYMRLTDKTGSRTFRTFPIGQMVSFSRPEGQVDKKSNLHVLYANGPHSFSYTMFDPSGELVARQIYDYVNSRPRLQVNQDGEVVVAGGSLREQPAKTSQEQNTKQ